MVQFVLKGAFCIVAGAIALLWNYQDMLLYLPTVHSEDKRKRQCCFNDSRFRTPTAWDPTLHYEDVWIRCADDVYIKAWFLLHPEDQRRKRPTCIYFHGNAGNVGFRLQNAAGIYHTCQMNILMVEYRGYGDSEGTPTEPGIRLDAVSALEYVRGREDIDGDSIFIFGRSLGGAAALSLVSRQDEIAGFIIENAFSSLADMVKVLSQRMGIGFIGKLGRVLDSFLTSPWENLKSVGQLTKPILFISGTNDELIPAEQMQALYATCQSEDKEIYRVVGGDHNGTWMKGGMDYYNTITAFLTKSTRGYPTSSFP